MKQWVVCAKRADFNAIAEKFDITPMLARIIRNRDITDDDAIDLYLNGTVDNMHDPYLLKDIDKASKILIDTVNTGKKIFIIGDYDIDGICSSYILYKGITSAGGVAKVRLPDRARDGYGMNQDMVDEALDFGASLIITCDNGIAAYSEIKYAKSKGLKVIVTDHHEVPYEAKNGVKHYITPPADAVVDPKQEDCTYPFKEICGGMVALKLMQCMYETMGPGLSTELSEELLMFAGFATVGDVMVLRDENRIVVKHAINQMKTTKNHGMNALIDVTGTDRNKITPYTIGFILGPHINATGRLDTAVRALDLFTSETYEDALSTAEELKSLNDSRKELTENFKKAAIDAIESDSSYNNEKVLVVYLPDCHESLAGIIAGRIRELYYKPVFVLTGRDASVKGSGRSIASYNMYAEMNRVGGLFSKYGGHKMAAGLSMNEADIEIFRKQINDNCTLTEADLIEKALIDIPMPIKYATIGFAEELGRLEPYGNGNPKPLFAQKDVNSFAMKKLGKNNNTVKLKLKSDDMTGTGIDAMCYGDADEIIDSFKNKGRIDVLYEIGINEYNGTKNVQLTIKDWK